MHNNARGIAETSTGTIAQYPHGYREKCVAMCGSIYWVNMNADMENIIKNCSTCLDFQQVSPKRESFITRYWPNHEKSLE